MIFNTPHQSRFLWRYAKRAVAALTLAFTGCQAQLLPARPTPMIGTIQLVVEDSAAPLLQDLTHAYPTGELLLAWDIQVGDQRTVNLWLNTPADDPNTPPHYALTSHVPTDQSWWSTPIAQDGLALVVNTSNPIVSLSPAQLRSLFTGRVNTWRELGSFDVLTQPILRPPESADAHHFRTFILGDRPLSSNAIIAASSRQLIDQVSKIPGGIGMVSMRYLPLEPEKIRPVPIDGRLPTAQTVANGTYPLRYTLSFVGTKSPDPQKEVIYRNFFAWVQSEAGQAIVKQHYAGVR
jgi:hypothetical protein